MENNRKDHFISIFHAIAPLTTRIKHDGDINIKTNNHPLQSSLVMAAQMPADLIYSRKTISDALLSPSSLSP